MSGGGWVLVLLELEGGRRSSIEVLASSRAEAVLAGLRLPGVVSAWVAPDHESRVAGS